MIVEANKEQQERGEKHQIVPIMALNLEFRQKMIRKARQLCEYIPNLIIYDAQLTI